MGKFKKLQEDIENVTNKEVVKQTRISGVATIVLIIWIVKITLIVLMSNPIFTALATVLIVSSIFVCANK